MHKPNRNLQITIAILLANIFFSSSSYARLGATSIECTQLYGTPSLYVPQKCESYYDKAGYHIYAHFFDGKVDAIFFQKIKQAASVPLDSSDITFLLNSNFGSDIWHQQKNSKDWTQWSTEKGNAAEYVLGDNNSYVLIFLSKDYLERTREASIQQRLKNSITEDTRQKISNDLSAPERRLKEYYDNTQKVAQSEKERWQRIHDRQEQELKEKEAFEATHHNTASLNNFFSSSRTSSSLVSSSERNDFPLFENSSGPVSISTMNGWSTVTPLTGSRSGIPNSAPSYTGASDGMGFGHKDSCGWITPSSPINTDPFHTFP